MNQVIAAERLRQGGKGIRTAAFQDYPTIPACIKKTWAEEGVRGFYRGLGTNLVRVLPGTCVTFVVYENLAWLLRTTAVKRERRKQLEA